MSTEIAEWFREEAFEELEEDPDTVHRGQLRMAYRLAKDYKDKLMYVRGLGWHYWYSNRWIEDKTGRAERYVFATLKKAHKESFGDEHLKSDVRKCETSAGIDGVLKLASKMSEFAFTADDLDSEPYLLNVANGTLDLLTMELRPHDPADRITKTCDARYNPASPGEAWSRFLERSLPDPEVRCFLQRYVGQALVGRTMEHALAILTGTGRNGKGVWDRAINKALGGYAISVRPELLLSRDGQHTTDEMDLMGVRWVTMSEIDKGRVLADATVKRLTGGDTIRARRMRQDSVEFEPSHALAMITNYLPKTGSDDEAIWARLKVIPFDVVIPPEEQDPHLNEKLDLELDAVLSWAIQGWVDYQAKGLAAPAKVLNRTAAYRSDTDGVSLFLEDRCIKGPGYNVAIEALWKTWEGWAYDTGFTKQAPTKRDFNAVLEARGFQQKNSGGRKWIHLGLKSDSDTTQGQW